MNNVRLYACVTNMIYDYSGAHISSDSEEIIQLFVKLKFIKINVNGMRVDIFSKRYALPLLLQAFSLALAWIQPSLNTFL